MNSGSVSDLLSRRLVQSARSKFSTTLNTRRSRAKSWSDFLAIQSVRPARHTLVGSSASVSELEARRIKYKMLLHYTETLRSKEKELASRQEPAAAALPVLESADMKAVLDALNTRGSNVACKIKRVEVTNDDLRTLNPGAWLNDNVIDAFLSALTETSTETKSFAFSTHFFSRLENDGYKAVRRWAIRQKVDVFKMDKVLVPINRGNTHWILGCIDNKNKEINVYDSLSGYGRSEAPVLLDYMQHEAERLGVACPQYKLNPQKQCPRQTNGVDCGVFVCANSYMLASNKPLTFSQSQIADMRMYMAHFLLTNSQ